MSALIRALIPPARNVTRVFNFKEKTLFGPGPSNCYPSVLEAISNQPYGIFIPEMHEVMVDVREGLKYAFQTKNEMTFCMSGTGMSGMEATFMNLLEPGDKALLLKSGLWGTRAADIVSRLNGAPIVLEKPVLGEPFTFEEIEKSLQKHQPSMLFVAQGESSTGLAQPVENLGQLCHKYNCLLIVDTVASLGGLPFLMDKWEVDVAYSGTQKCLSCPPGLAPISFSARACEKIAKRKVKCPSFYLDFNLMAAHWGLTGPNVYHNTPAINTLFGLREALSILAKEGLEASWKRHRNSAELLWKGIEDMGLQMYIKNPEYRLPTINAIVVPDDLSDPYRVNAYADSVGVELGKALPPLSGKLWRVGLMGYNSNPEKVQLALATMRDGLQKIGYVTKVKSEL